jgi:hypothetical protein
LVILEIPGPAHPATPVVGHPGNGCVGPWAHNAHLMQTIGLVELPLPCHDQYCNEHWIDAH